MFDTPAIPEPTHPTDASIILSSNATSPSNVSSGQLALYPWAHLPIGNYAGRGLHETKMQGMLEETGDEMNGDFFRLASSSLMPVLIDIIIYISINSDEE